MEWRGGELRALSSDTVGGAVSFLAGKGDTYELFLLCERCCSRKTSRKSSFRPERAAGGCRVLPKPVFPILTPGLWLNLRF